jgi:hypothetical protein
LGKECVLGFTEFIDLLTSSCGTTPVSKVCNVKEPAEKAPTLLFGQSPLKTDIILSENRYLRYHHPKAILAKIYNPG